jgi:hypothetical protein
LKTQIITLESHDDLISVRDKLSWVKTPRVLLVWPKYEQVNLRMLDLKVLQRHSDSLGAQLGLVTRRANIRRDAESLGIPVFGTTSAAQKDFWPESAPRTQRMPKKPRQGLRAWRDAVYPKESAWRTSFVGRVLTFTVGVIAFVSVAGLFVPRATVTLYPEAQTQSAIIPVAADASIESVFVTGSIPARKLSSIVETTQSLAVISQISIPKSKAKGIARFTNLSQGEVQIPAGTIVSTASDNPIRFVTLNDTLLPPGVDEFVEVPIEALEAGENGNVLAGSLIVVDGPLGLSIAVGNPSSTSGGSDSNLIGASEEDRTKLHDVVLDNLRRDAEEDLRAQIMPSDLLLMDTLEIVEVLEETYDPPPGQAGNQLNLHMKVEFSAQYVSHEDMLQLSNAALDASIPQGFEAFGPAAYKLLTDPSMDNAGVSHFELDVSRTLYRTMNETEVLSIISGMTPAEAIRELAPLLSLRQATDIKLTPAWWPWLPLIPFNISVETQ